MAASFPLALNSRFFFHTVSYSSSSSKSRHLLCRALPPSDSPSSSSKFIRRNLLLTGICLGLNLGSWTSMRPNFTQMDGAAAAVAAEASSGEFPKALDSVVELSVKRPRKNRSKEEKEREEEVLVVDDIEFRGSNPIKFDVLIDADDWRTITPRSTEFAGSFVNVPSTSRKVKTRLMLGISELIQDIGADGDDELKVTLVPRITGNGITVGGLWIDYIF